MQSSFWESDVCGYVVRKYPAFYGTGRFIILFKRERHWTLSQIIGTKDLYLQGYTSIQSPENQPIFQRSISSPSSESKNTQSQKPPKSR
jgi:hypothetical protein